MTVDTLKTRQAKAAVITLNDEQIKAIRLRLSSIENRNLRTTLKVNGKLTLPPQNQAQVIVLMGGIVKTIDVSEGSLSIRDRCSLAGYQRDHPITAELYGTQIETCLSATRTLPLKSLQEARIKAKEAFL